MQSQLSLPETNPISFEINSNKTRRNCKKVHEGISIKKKPDFILYVYFLNILPQLRLKVLYRSGYKTDKKVDQKEDVESEKVFDVQ